MSICAGLVGKEIVTLDLKKAPMHEIESYFKITDYSSSRGETVHMLSSGVNSLRPPSVILESLRNDADQWQFLNSYCGALGESILRNAVLLYEESIKGGSWPAVEAMITFGAGDGLRIIFEYLRAHGAVRRVLVVGPQYAVVHQTITSAGLVFQEVLSQQEQRFHATPEEIAAALRETGAEAVFLTEPNNPSGEQHTLEEFAAIVGTLKAQGAYLILDKISADFQACGAITCLNYGQVLDEYAYWDRTYVVDSLSKRRALSGMRFGYVLGEQNLMDFALSRRYGGCPALVAVHGIARDLAYSADAQRTETDVTISQAMERRLHELNPAALALLTSIEGREATLYLAEIREMYRIIHENRRVVRQYLHPWMCGETPLEAGFNYLICLRAPSPSIEPAAFARRIFDSVRVACYPLECFVADQELARTKQPADQVWMRVSCAAEPAAFREMVRQLHAFMEQH
jgi:aspartate/methionine/tyrosine aminotransferase